MLPLPENDLTDPETLAGWVELSVLAVDDGQVSIGQVAEELRDSNLLKDALPEETEDLDGEPERLAEQLAADVWSVLEERKRLLGASAPYYLDRRVLTRISRRKTLPDVAGYLTMLLLEAAGRDWYSGLQLGAGDDVRTRFELVAAASLRGLGKCRVERLGAPFPGSDIKGFINRVKHLVGSFDLDPNEAELKRFTHPHEKDRGLDLVVRWWEHDASGGMPYLLVQCATGKNWVRDKAAEPPMVSWRKFATWDGPTLKSIAVPYSVQRPRGLADAWLRTEGALIFDRLRLARGRPDVHLDDASRKQLTEWCRDQLKKIAFAGTKKQPGGGPAGR